jgi:hypothetical protein
LRGRIMQNKVIDFAELSHIGVILDKIAAWTQLTFED